LEAEVTADADDSPVYNIKKENGNSYFKIWNVNIAKQREREREPLCVRR
jgi:hypothetical protein